MNYHTYNGSFRKKEIVSIKSKQCPCCNNEMKAISIKNDYIDDWRYECSNCYHWEF